MKKFLSIGLIALFSMSASAHSKDVQTADMKEKIENHLYLNGVHFIDGGYVDDGYHDSNYDYDDIGHNENHRRYHILPTSKVERFCSNISKAESYKEKRDFIVLQCHRSLQDYDIKWLKYKSKKGYTAYTFSHYDKSSFCEDLGWNGYNNSEFTRQRCFSEINRLTKKHDHDH